MSNILLALWVALIAADRIDFAGGHGAFIVTPFLALTPIVVIAELARRSQNRIPLRLSRNAVLYAAAASALLCVALLSTFFSDEVLVSGSRSALLVLQVTGTFVVALLASDRADLPAILARGAMLSLPLFVFCDLMETLWWIGRAPELLRAGSATIRFDAIQTLGPIPRLAGPVADGNRGGFVLVCYIIMLARGERSKTWRQSAITLAVIMLALTISRSATLAAVGTLGMSLLTRRRRLSVPALAAVVSALGIAAAVVLWNPRVLDPVAKLAYSPLATRVSSGEGSAQDHLTLLSRGIAEGSASVRRALIGLGYGNAYLVLQDIFPGNRYGNFHSLYVTMFAESGVFALLLVVTLMGVPAVRAGPWRAPVVGALAFNIFYQTTAEPMFWFLLAMAWLSMRPIVFTAGLRQKRPALSARFSS